MSTHLHASKAPIKPVIYLMIAEEQQGPFTEGEVRQMHKLKTITPETLYWKEGMPEWRAVVDLLPPTGRPAIQAVKVPERRKTTGAGPRRAPSPKPAGQRSLPWVNFEWPAALSPSKNPALAKGLVVVLGLAVALTVIYLLMSTGFVANHLQHPDPPPGPFDDDQ